MTGPALGCVADDVTGATDLAGNLVRAGYRTSLLLDLPTEAAGEVATPTDVDAVVVAQKTRTAPVAEAVEAALAAHRHLAGLGCARFWFKYCSTFDSTPRGNIGPVLDALLEATGSPWTVACPAFPDTGRTVYQGHLFVGDRLLSESSMRHHPLTPMRDPDLVRVLGAQTRHRVGLLPHPVLAGGDAAVDDHLRGVLADGVRVVVTDVLTTADFAAVHRVTRDLPLVTGGSGLALALPPPAGRGAGPATDLPRAKGPGVVLAGSVSETTLAQTAHARRHLHHHKLPVEGLLTDPEGTVRRAVDFARRHAGPRPVLLHSADDRTEVSRAQQRLGAHRLASAVERGLAACARDLVDDGFGRLVIAGGETSGAVVAALGLTHLRVGPSVAPGVPWTAATYRGRPLNLVCKSGNFGAPDLFVTAEEAL